MNDKDYQEFLHQKRIQKTESGFHIEEAELNPMLFDFQKYCVKRALTAGKFALFEDCGLGKTIQQLEWADKVCKHIDRPVLILAPLSVIGQTIEEGKKFGYAVTELGLTNYQNCHNQIFASLDFSFEATYQGIRRSYRFGQAEISPRR